MKLFEIAKYKTEITIEEGLDLLEKHCKDVKDSTRPIVRGMSEIPGGIGIIHGDAGGRQSANTSNHYTVILDAVLGKRGFPKRSKSIICANWKNKSHASAYGELYAIIPFDGVKIGVCPDDDMWATEITIGGTTDNIESWNNDFGDIGIDEESTFREIASQLKEAAMINRKPGQIKLPWLDVFAEGNPEKILDDAYSKPFKLTTTKEALYEDDAERREVWIGGKCLAIELSLYEKHFMDYA